MLYSQLRLLFEKVSIAKPSSSRNSSIEAFVVCQEFKAGEFLNLPLEGGFDPSQVGDWRAGAGGMRKDNGKNIDILPSIVPFVACGDLSGYVAPTGQFDFLDADKSYPIEELQALEKEYIVPIAPPINPPYETSLAKAKDARLKKAGAKGKSLEV